MRLIDADALDEALTALRFTADGELAHWGDRKDWCLHGSEIEMLIANAPTVDAEPIRHGCWDDTKVAFYLKCSECGCCVRSFVGEVFLDYAQEWNYCPNCGAKMDEED